MLTRFTLTLASTILGAVAVNAAPILIIGTPANSYLNTPTQASPQFAAVINFDSLTPGSTFDPATYAAQGVTISSPEGLIVQPFSAQTFPNELFDNSSNGTA